MATKVKPTRLNITGTPQPGNVPVYVDADNFQWGAGGGGGGASFGRFLSLWDCTAGQPISFPEATPYLYLTGDYYMVSVVSAATPPVNYRPDGNSYTGVASSVTELDEVEVGDTYVYDGTTWLLQSNHGKTVTFANIAGDPYDNTNLDSALDAKQDLLVSGTNIKTVNSNSLLGSGNVSVGDMKYADYNWVTKTGGSITLSLNSTITPSADFTINAPGAIEDGQVYVLRVTSGAVAYDVTLGTNISNPYSVDTTLTANATDQFVFIAVGGVLELQPLEKDTTYTAGTGINIDANNEISNTGVTSFNGSTGVITYTAPVTSVNGSTGAVTVDQVDDTAYASSWNGVTNTAPSKNAVYDKIESVVSSIPTVNDATLTITQNGTSKGTFTANQSSAATIALTDTTYSAGTGIVLNGTTFSNSGVTSVNGNTGDVTITDSNTKTFYLGSTSDLTTAQAAYDRWNAGKNAIVVCQGIYYYYWSATAGSAIIFVENGLVTGSPVSDTDIRKRLLYINFSSDVVSSITTGERSFAKVLSTDIDYSPAYTPLYDGSPATKKYVDDNAGITNDTTGTTTTVTSIRCGTQAEYDALSSYSQSTIYHIY